MPGSFPSQRVSNGESVCMSWQRHGMAGANKETDLEFEIHFGRLIIGWNSDLVPVVVDKYFDDQVLIISFRLTASGKQQRLHQLWKCDIQSFWWSVHNLAIYVQNNTESFYNLRHWCNCQFRKPLYRTSSVHDTFNLLSVEFKHLFSWNIDQKAVYDRMVWRPRNSWSLSLMKVLNSNRFGFEC